MSPDMNSLSLSEGTRILRRLDKRQRDTLDSDAAAELRRLQALTKEQAKPRQPLSEAAMLAVIEEEAFKDEPKEERSQWNMDPVVMAGIVKYCRAVERAHGIGLAPAEPVEETKKQPIRIPSDEQIIDHMLSKGIIDCLADPWDLGVGDRDTSRSIKKDVIRTVREAITRWGASPQSTEVSPAAPALGAEPIEPILGDLLPPVGSTVLITFPARIPGSRTL